MEQRLGQCSRLLRMNPFDRFHHAPVRLHQYRKKIVLGYINPQHQPLACDLGCDFLPVHALDIRRSVCVLFQGETSWVTVQSSILLVSSVDLYCVFRGSSYLFYS